MNHGTAWRVLYSAQRTRTLATTGRTRGSGSRNTWASIVIMIGFLIQWPTLVTLVMFPILVTMYVRLARHEERDALMLLGEAYASYAAVTPPFVPRLGRFRQHTDLSNLKGDAS